jgi:hypothetical protein
MFLGVYCLLRWPFGSPLFAVFWPILCGILYPIALLIDAHERAKKESVSLRTSIAKMAQEAGFQSPFRPAVYAVFAGLAIGVVSAPMFEGLRVWYWLGDSYIDYRQDRQKPPDSVGVRDYTESASPIASFRATSGQYGDALAAFSGGLTCVILLFAAGTGICLGIMSALKKLVPAEQPPEKFDLQALLKGASQVSLGICVAVLFAIPVHYFYRNVLRGMADFSVRRHDQILFSQFINGYKYYHYRKNVVDKPEDNLWGRGYAKDLTAIDTSDCSPEFRTAFARYVGSWYALAEVMKNDRGRFSDDEAKNFDGKKVLEALMRQYPKPTQAMLDADSAVSALTADGVTKQDLKGFPSLESAGTDLLVATAGAMRTSIDATARLATPLVPGLGGAPDGEDAKRDLLTREHVKQFRSVNHRFTVLWPAELTLLRQEDESPKGKMEMTLYGCSRFDPTLMLVVFEMSDHGRIAEEDVPTPDNISKWCSSLLGSDSTVLAVDKSEPVKLPGKGWGATIRTGNRDGQYVFHRLAIRNTGQRLYLLACSSSDKNRTRTTVVDEVFRSLQVEN